MSIGYGSHAIFERSPAAGSSPVSDIPEAAAATQVKVYIVSETRLFSEGLSAILDRKGRFEVVGLGANTDALDIIERLAPELVLLDMAGSESLAVLRQLRVI